MEVGSVRIKNTMNILIKNMMDACIGAISFWLIGYAFAFGDNNRFIGEKVVSDNSNGIAFLCFRFPSRKPVISWTYKFSRIRWSTWISSLDNKFHHSTRNFTTSFLRSGRICIENIRYSRRSDPQKIVPGKELRFLRFPVGFCCHSCHNRVW